MSQETNCIVIAHDMRSTHNVGSLLRTAEGLGVTVYISGYTPYPSVANDTRLPHIAQKLTKQISKTALGAEKSAWKHAQDIIKLITELKQQGYTVVALEQAPNSVSLPEFTPSKKVAVLLGREVDGIDPELMQHCDLIVEIPMFGSKESFNVVEAATMAMYHLRFVP